MSPLINYNIQPDFVDCIRDVQNGVLAEDSFYVNVEPSAYEVDEFRVKVKLQEEVLVFDAGTGNSFKQTGRRTFEARLGSHHCKFQTAHDNYSSAAELGSPDFTSVDVFQKDGTCLYAIGNTAGEVSVHDSQREQIQILKGHKAEITDVKFFPSGQVVLSSSMDMQLKVWSVLDGSNPRTLKGHKGSITTSAIVDRGRNVLSGSKDGTVKLWECGSGEAIHTFARSSNRTDAINAMVLLGHATTASDDKHLEFGTTGKIVLAGHESGTISCHDLYSKEQLLELPNQFMSACWSLTSNSQCSTSSTESPLFLYAGYANGVLAQWDLRMPSKAIDSICWNQGSPVTALHFQSQRLFASSDLDSSAAFHVDLDSGTIQNPTFLVSQETKISAYAPLDDQQRTLAVGSGGLCAVY
ncbi:Rpn14p [Lachancea thermotolerans CBS 6340]|uniref:KLTH0E08096p n=1 Tax=Lachancea thermotolerans (strain ATCC 56472 / CBS 6340 / NRRL Y-8284) TaxID=559295 RepID=C5DHY2_LACTC|nr:KLTH0E08096p [Lachancea thermotolerans CBS 6340]CAR23393.1 KLTH0E08096p [Lachancea thermotolerans CBS 6340]